ncbi:hypothetical protein Lal_00000842 [Lupinus albus]|nr:hypothetical protein Lal_00000842 [Lupinus albus]
MSGSSHPALYFSLIFASQIEIEESSGVSRCILYLFVLFFNFTYTVYEALGTVDYDILGVVMSICLINWQWSWLLYVLLIHIVINKSQAISPDGEVLLSFRTAVVSSDGVLVQWRPEDPDPCKWKGVKCDPKTKSVTHLFFHPVGVVVVGHRSSRAFIEAGSLSHHKLSGPLSPDLGKLEHLRVLALHDNNLYGTIPPTLRNCTDLQEMHVLTLVDMPSSFP